jgi:hypothetical protein
VYVLQVEDLRREALQNQRELLQEKTKVKALSEGKHTVYSSNCFLRHTHSSKYTMAASHASLFALSKTSVITAAQRMRLRTLYTRTMSTTAKETTTLDSNSC